MAKTRNRQDGAASQGSNITATAPAPPEDGRSRSYDPDRVATRAYEMYLERGGSHGQDWDDWLAAERELGQHRAGSE